MTALFPVAASVRMTDVLAGDGATTQFSGFSFKVFNVADIAVYVRPAEGTRSLSSDVTIAKASDDVLAGFAVTFGTPPAATDKLVLVGRREHWLYTDVTRGGSIDRAQLHAEISKMTIMLLEIARDMGRAVTTEFGAAPPTLAALTVGHFAKFEAATNRLVDGGYADEIVKAHKCAAAMLEAASGVWFPSELPTQNLSDEQFVSANGRAGTLQFHNDRKPNTVSYPTAVAGIGYVDNDGNHAYAEF